MACGVIFVGVSGGRAPYEAGNRASEGRKELRMRQDYLLRMGGVACGLAVALSGLAAGAQARSSADPTTIEVCYTATFSEADLRFEEVGGYDVVSLSEGSVFSELGRPVLPEMGLRIAIPAGTEATEVKARSIDAIELEGAFDLMPGQPPLPTSQSRARLAVGPDEAVYRSSEPYPGRLAVLVGQGDLAGQEIAELLLYPVQYVPGRRKLVLHRTVELTLTCRRSGVTGAGTGGNWGASSSRQLGLYRKMLETMVVNPEDVVVDLSRAVQPLDGPSLLLPQGDYDHVVITSEAIAPGFQPLVDWHTKKGLRDTVVTPTWIYANYSGGSNAEKIRNFIIDASSPSNWGTMYFLLGGENATVPFVYRTYYSETTPSDQYYSDYDDDWVNEVFVGRVTAESASEATAYVNTVLKYEQDPPLSGYPLDVLLIGMDTDAMTHCQYLKDVIDGYLPARFNVSKVYDSHGGNHRDSVITYLNAGQNLVNHADHANWNYMGTGDYWHGWGITNGDVWMLTNYDKMSVVVSLGCWPNAMDQVADCIAEIFVVQTENRSGVAFTGNTRSGWYQQGQPQSLSGILDRDWWRGVFQAGQTDLGQAIVWSKHQFSHSSSITKHCEWTFNLLGDPAMPLWLDTPGQLDVTHPASINTGPQDFTVEVEENGVDVAGALVCLMKGSEVYAVGTTGSNGKVTLSINPVSGGTMDVTVTAQDFLPYEGACQIGGGAPDVTVTLTPDATNVPRGGQLGYTVTVTNNTSSPVDLEYWTDITLWNGNPYAGNPLFGPYAATVNAYETRQAHLHHTVPMNAPLQTYTCHGRIGVHPSVVWNEDSFEFTVVP
jgi:hypothetical protein